MIVLDCNAVLAIALNTPAGAALEELILNDEEVVAPTLLFEEVAHALAKYRRAGELTRSQAHTVGTNALSLIDRFIEPQGYWEEACQESVHLGHSSYGLFYLLIARRTGATLVTLDRKLQSLCRNQGIDCTESITL